MTTTAVVVENQTAVDCDLDALRDLVDYLLQALRLHGDCEVGVTLVDEDRITELHVEWMHEPGPTDVLSFPIDELRSAPDGEQPEPGTLGDIVLCPSVAAVQAVERGRTLDAELQFLTIHAMLHLIGFDHGTAEDEAAMFAKQDALLAGWRSHVDG